MTLPLLYRERKTKKKKKGKLPTAPVEWLYLGALDA